MAFTIAAASNLSPGTGLILPDLISFLVVDDGNGGTINLNALGQVNPTVGSAVDFATWFGVKNVNSAPVMRAFRAIARGLPTVVQAAFLQIINNIEIIIAPIGPNEGTYPGMPYWSVTAGLSGGPANVPYLQLIGPGIGGEGAIAGQWRVDLKLRHSITN